MKETPYIELRQGRRSDIEFIYELRTETMKEYFEQAGGWDEREQRDYAGAHIENTKIIVVDGRDAGVIKVLPQSGGLDLHQFQILPGFQNRGIGGLLIGEILQEAAGAGADVTLDVLKVNPALRLYKRMGFRITSEDEHNYYMRCDAGAQGG